jgi:hypothetical protein
VYVVGPTLRNIYLSSGSALIGALIVGFGWPSYGPVSLLGLGLAWPMVGHLVQARQGVAWFRVDAQGMYFGQIDDEHVTAPVQDAPVVWSWIGSVVVYRIRRLRRINHENGYSTQDKTFTAVGVTRRGGPEGEIALYQLFEDYELDRAALDRAVARYGGGVPVVDGPQVLHDERP